MAAVAPSSLGVAVNTRYESKRPLLVRATVLGGHPATAERLAAALPGGSAGCAVSHAISHGTV